MDKKVAYFSMEYALSDGAPYFAGGLGVLAADYLLESGKQGKELIAFGLGYHKKDVSLQGFGFQKTDLQISLNFTDRKIDLAVWEKDYGLTRIYLFDSMVPSNSPEDQVITSSPYGPDYWTMLRQQLILAFGSTKLMDAMGYVPDVVHLNEGHTAFVIWALEQANIKARIVATKHTILSESGLFIPKEDMQKLYQMCSSQPCPPFEEFFARASDERHMDRFSTNKFLLKYAAASSGVSKAHTEFEKQIHINSPLIPITNGINVDRWRNNLFTKPVDQISDQELELIHHTNKKTAIGFINETEMSNLSPDFLTIVWSRRLVDYKQPELLFSDLARLEKLVNENRGVQFIIAGSVHTADPSSMAIAQRIKDWLRNPALSTHIAFHPHNSLSEARMLVAGADVWLNTPRVGKEACGTSGMKAGLNGSLLVSTPDGWMPEVDWTDIGWLLPQENTANKLYELCENEIIPIYYSNKADWIARMRKTIKIVENGFTTARMLADYWEKLY